MSNFKEVRLSSKMVVISVVGISLGIGLCGVGWESGGPALQAVAYAGVAVFWLSVIALLFSLVLLLFDR